MTRRAHTLLTPSAPKISCLALETGPQVEENLETGEPAGFVTSRNGAGEGPTRDHKGGSIDLVTQVDANWPYGRRITEPKAHSVSKIIQFVRTVCQARGFGWVAGVKSGRRSRASETDAA